MYALVSSLWIALIAALVGPAVGVALMIALDDLVPVDPPTPISLVGASPASGSGVPNTFSRLGLRPCSSSGCLGVHEDLRPDHPPRRQLA